MRQIIVISTPKEPRGVAATRVVSYRLVLQLPIILPKSTTSSKHKKVMSNKRIVMLSTMQTECKDVEAMEGMEHSRRARKPIYKLLICEAVRSARPIEHADETHGQ